MRVLEAIGLTEIKRIQVQFLFDGSPLQTTCREFCLWWLRSFENGGKYK